MDPRYIAHAEHASCEWLESVTKRLVEKAHATSERPLELGGIQFWIDADGPWAGKLSYDMPLDLWDRVALAADITRARIR